MNTDQLARNEGLPNNGNTCFLNSVIQSLYAIDSFREHILNQKGQKKLTSLIRKIFLALQQGKASKQRKQRMKKLINYLTKCDIDYQGYSQQDSSQFLVLILGNLFQQIPQIQSLFKVYYKFNCLSCGNSLKLKQYTISKFQILCQNDFCNSNIDMELINWPKVIIYCGNPYTQQNLDISHVSEGKIIFCLVSQILYSGNGQSGHCVCRRRLTQKKEVFKVFNDSSVEDQSRKSHFEAKIQIFELKTIQKQVLQQAPLIQPAPTIILPEIPEKPKEVSSEVKKQKKNFLINYIINFFNQFYEAIASMQG